MGVSWTDEMREALRELWTVKGKSGSEIAGDFGSMFGVNVTRESILGAVYRMGIARRISPSSPVARNYRSRIPAGFTAAYTVANYINVDRRRIIRWASLNNIAQMGNGYLFTADDIQRARAALNPFDRKKMAPRLKPAQGEPSGPRVAKPSPVLIVVPKSIGKTLLELGRRECRWPSSLLPEPADEIRFCGHQTNDGSPYCAHHAKQSGADVQPTQRRHFREASMRPASGTIAVSLGLDGRAA